MHDQQGPHLDSEAHTELPYEGTVQALLAELARLLACQLETIDGLDSKAGVIFGAAGILATLTTFAYASFVQAAVTSGPFYWWLQPLLRGGLLLSLGMSGATVFSLLRTLRVLGWQLPVDPERVEEEYLEHSPSFATAKLLASYINCTNHNTTTIRRKAAWAQISLSLLAANLLVLMVLTAIGALAT